MGRDQSARAVLVVDIRLPVYSASADGQRKTEGA